MDFEICLKFICEEEGREALESSDQEQGDVAVQGGTVYLSHSIFN